MMVGGFGLVGGTIRARRKVKVSYAWAFPGAIAVSTLPLPFSLT